MPAPHVNIAEPLLAEAVPHRARRGGSGILSCFILSFTVLLSWESCTQFWHEQIQTIHRPEAVILQRSSGSGPAAFFERLVKAKPKDIKQDSQEDNGTSPIESKDGKADTPPETVALQLRQGLTQQCQRELEAYGESISIMVVGESGVGKTSLLANLFHSPLDWPSGERTVGVRVKVVKMQLGGDGETCVPFEARLIDSPGWGDTLSLRRSFAIVTRYIDKTFREQLNRETAVHRQVKVHHDTRVEHVDVVLYVFSPHRCKGIDLAFLSKLRKRVVIVPILAKADTMTTEELTKFRQEIVTRFEEANIQVAHPPVAVICVDPPSLGGPRHVEGLWPPHGGKLGRTYPWGVAESEDNSHSELPKLRKFLLTDGLLKLKKSSQMHYEDFRTRTLRSQSKRQSMHIAVTSAVAIALAIGKDARKAVSDWLSRVPLPKIWLPVIQISWCSIGGSPAPPLLPPRPEPTAKPAFASWWGIQGEGTSGAGQVGR
eukprot:gnl/TRDRNA2_/TRDRNA2_34608_c0_seq1.p1 gnl/TRDRNA2_/TRDRNA2_34608_c0~~gnl/TRDRNA2_/TRDRNA2_34608_c0_seq1.p1  ORF type:complete len:497 (+),score=63.56 gnl/TRDRNA2_/TRDRNA2_34608_c0_seq1:31-1491(+)